MDYSKYSLNELLEVKDNISTDSPNYPLLMKELENRKPEIEAAHTQAAEESFQLAEHRVKIIGYFQLAAVLFISGIYIYETVKFGFDFINFLLMIFFVSLNLAAGYTALKEMKKYYWLTIVNQSLQVISLSVGAVVLNYTGLGGAYLLIEWTQGFEFGVSMYFSPGFSYTEYFPKAPQQSLSIDVLAIIFIGAIVTVLDGRDAKVEEHTEQN